MAFIEKGELIQRIKSRLSAKEEVVLQQPVVFEPGYDQNEVLIEKVLPSYKLSLVCLGEMQDTVDLDGCTCMQLLQILEQI